MNISQYAIDYLSDYLIYGETLFVAHQAGETAGPQ
jgi:hypothetical protein